MQLTFRYFVIAGAILALAIRADAAHPNNDMMNNASIFSSCVRLNSGLHQGELHQMKMLGGNVASALIMACGNLANSYVYQCEKSGYAEDHCYGDLQLFADDIFTQVDAK